MRQHQRRSSAFKKWLLLFITLGFIGGFIAMGMNKAPLQKEIVREEIQIDPTKTD
ncbi:MAG: hypothetical protein MRY32_07135 [Rickettsiales bacterium]|nr:hypothetical protein [Rickettsiales bacterium]